MPTELDALETRIQEGVSAACHALSRAGARRGEWTARVKQALAELGQREQMQVWAHGTGLASSEWLFDLCWADCRDGDWRRLRKLVLACEIEWNNHPDWLLEDFLKLAVAQSDYRVFIFAASPVLEDRNQIIDALRTAWFGVEWSAAASNRCMILGVPPCEDAALICEAWGTR